MQHKPIIHKNRPFLFFIFIVIIFILGIVILKIPSNEKSKEDGKTKTVAVSKVIRTDLSQTITLSAELVPFTEATLFAKVPGYLKEIRVDIGDRVKEGEILAILEVPELVNILAKNKAALDLAKLDFIRITGVQEKRPELIAQETVDRVTKAYEAAKASHEHSKTMYTYSIITAPYDGVITARFVDEGAMIQEGTSTNTQAIPIVHIADNSKFRLTFPVPESLVSFVKPGDLVAVEVLSTHKNLKAPISRIASKVTTDTRTMETQVDVYNNADLNLTPGTYASATLHIKEKEKALALPVAAVEIVPKPSVWLINSNNEIEERPVTLGIQTPYMIEILDGLKEGDLVVFGSRSSLTLGMKVQPKLTEIPNSTQGN
ncbi:MAG: hypothetical protein BGO67_09710 [Alphaproteobacteria bacterium 41-28]|nr:MAG: hypothetical protein BGO67_09710 [Alphaproteobacteria bacterium 41-28]